MSLVHLFSPLKLHNSVTVIILRKLDDSKRKKNNTNVVYSQNNKDVTVSTINKLFVTSQFASIKATNTTQS